MSDIDQIAHDIGLFTHASRILSTHINRTVNDNVFMSTVLPYICMGLVDCGFGGLCLKCQGSVSASLAILIEIHPLLPDPFKRQCAGTIYLSKPLRFKRCAVPSFGKRLRSAKRFIILSVGESRDTYRALLSLNTIS